MLLVVAATMVVVPSALANHSTKDLVSIGPTGGNGPNDVFFSFASGDGARAFFETPESLVAADTDTAYDIYERQGGTTTLISTGPSGGNGNFDAFPSDVSSNGLRVFFETEESLVAGDTDAFFDVYQRFNGTTTLMSTGSTGGNGPLDVFFHDISTDGARVFFETEEQLVAGDTDSQADVYERVSGTTEPGFGGNARQRRLPRRVRRHLRGRQPRLLRDRGEAHRGRHATTRSTCTGA